MNKKYLYLIPFGILFIIVLNWHFNMVLIADDLVFLEKSVGSRLIFTEQRYFNWTQRNLIEFLILSVLRIDIIYWKIIDSAILTGIAVLITKIFSKNKTLLNSAIASILLLITIYASEFALGSAGFLTTTINYIWPTFAIIASFYILKEYILKNKDLNNFKKYLLYIVYLILLIFGTNNEQLSVITFGIYIFLFIYLYYKKIQIPKIFYLGFLVILISLINAAICPGNMNRYYIEMEVRFPEYINATLIDKGNIGISNILNRCVIACDYITIVLLALIGIYSYIENKINLKTIISFIPFVIVGIFWILMLMGNNYFHLILVSNIGIFGYYPISFKGFLFSIIIYLIYIICLIYGFVQIYLSDKKIGLNISILFIIGALSTVMYGFTPSTPSIERMYIFFYFINMVICYILIQSIFKKNKLLHDKI